MVCSCVVTSKRVLLQIIFCSCVIGTTSSREKLGSLKEATTATPKTTSIKKWIYILPTNLRILLGHLLCLSLSKLSRNWIWDTSINLKQNFKKLVVLLHVLQTTQNWSFHVVVLPRTAKKCTKIYNARAQSLFCSLNLLFSDVPVTVAVVVILNSLTADRFPELQSSD